MVFPKEKAKARERRKQGLPPYRSKNLEIRGNPGASTTTTGTTVPSQPIPRRAPRRTPPTTPRTTPGGPSAPRSPHRRADPVAAQKRRIKRQSGGMGSYPGSRG